MVKLSKDLMADLSGGSKCNTTVGAIAGFGVGVMLVPTPLNLALGIVCLGVAAASSGGCDW